MGCYYCGSNQAPDKDGRCFECEQVFNPSEKERRNKERAIKEYLEDERKRYNEKKEVTGMFGDYFKKHKR